MFYYLSHLAHINLFSYLSVRAGSALFFSFIFTAFFMPKFIAWAKAKKASQPIYELAPKNHQKKSNTPTMGGIVLIFSSIFSSLLMAKFNVYVWLSLALLLLFALIGFKDDYSKIAHTNNQAGLKARRKFQLQILAAFFIALLLYFSAFSSELYLPFYKHPLLDLKFFSVIFWIFVIVASSNAVNLTDGLDGLATVPSIFALITLGIFAYLSGNAIFSQYLFLPKIPDVGESLVISAALCGSLLGFLWFNCYPAEVFMGDSGSLALGAYVGFAGILTKNEFLLILIGIIFVVETLSVILQVGSFKIFKKRIFLMAPLHHHFEIKGWSENKIIIRFWIIALLANLLALTALKIR